MTIVPVPEVSAAIIYRFLKFIDAHPEIKKVKICPECSMPAITGSASTPTLTCENCRDYFPRGESELETMMTSEYVKVIKELPLRNRGRFYQSDWDREQNKDNPPVTYKDLTASDLVTLANYTRHNY